jgi:RNAse (barnase) inhibitor barstar
MKQLFIQFQKDDGYLIHVRNENVDQVRDVLIENGYQIIKVNGEKIHDNATFFKVLAQSLNFPTYFGNNWDAWDECLRDLADALSDEKTAIIWDEALRSLERDPQSCIHGICSFAEIATWLKNKKRKTLEVFLLGNWIK